MTITKPKTEAVEECVLEECPLCALYPKKNPNAVTLAAMQETEDIISGKIPGKWYTSIEEARKDLGI